MYDNMEIDENVKDIPIDKIYVSKYNVRKRETDKDIDLLAKSIEKRGLLQPIVVVESGNNYELVIGQRRVLAFKKLGKKSIPALIKKISTSTDKVITSFTENIQRRDMPYRDKMEAAIELLSELKSKEAVAKELGISVQTVKSYLGYSAVPEEIKKMVDRGEISAQTATRITQRVENEQKAIAVAKLAKDVPNAYKRRLAIDIASKYPDKSQNEIQQLLEKMGKRYTMHFTTELFDRLKQASRTLKRDIDDIVFQAVDEWLETNQIA